MKGIKKMLAMLLAISMVVGMVPMSVSATEVDDASNVVDTIEANVVEVETTEITKQSEVENVIEDSAFSSTVVTTLDVAACAVSKKEAKVMAEAALGDGAVADLTEVIYETNGEGNVTAINVVSDRALAMAAAELDAIAEDTSSELTRDEVLEQYAQLQLFYENHPQYFGVPVPYFVEKGPINSLLAVFADGITWDAVGQDLDGDGIPEMSLEMVSMVIEGYMNALNVCVNGDSENGLPSMISKFKAATDDALSNLDDSMTVEEKMFVLNDWLASWCMFDINRIFNPNEEMSGQDQLRYLVETTLFGGLVGADYMFGGAAVPETICLGYTSAYTYLVQRAFPEIYLVDGNPDNWENPDNWKTKEQINGTKVMVSEEQTKDVQQVDEAGNLMYEYAVEGTTAEADYIAVVDSNGEQLKDADGNLLWYDASKPIMTTVTEEVMVEKVIDCTYIIDFVQIKWNAAVSLLGEDKQFEATHFLNAVRTDNTTDNWYYIDSCYNDIFVEILGRNRVETDGMMTHRFFLVRQSSLESWFKGNYESFDTLYADKAVDSKYENEWFTISTGPIVTDGDYYYYVENPYFMDILDAAMSGGDIEMDPNELMSGKDRLIARNRTTGEETILLDYPTGVGMTTSGQAISGVEALMATESEGLTKRYSAVCHTVAIKGNTLYLNSGNTIFTYNLDSGEIKPFKEYNEVHAVQDKSNPFTGMSFSIAGKNSENIVHTVVNHPVASLAIKADGKLHVSLATNFSEATSYKLEETNYNHLYLNYEGNANGGDNDNDEFLWSANFTETIDLECSHVYETVEVDASCIEAAYTENRCEKCGAIQEKSKDAIEGTEATGHHYIKFDETYYTKAEDGTNLTGTCYICVDCLHTMEALPEGESVNHAYVAESYTWSEDNSECSAELVCERCQGKKLDCVEADETNTKTVECTVTRETSDGEVIYTAEWSEAGCSGTTSKTTEELAAGTWGDNITWVLKANGTLILSGQGEMTECENVSGDAWSKYVEKDITKIVIEEGITSICDGVFGGCFAVEEVEIADSVTKIGKYAFMACHELKTVKLPENLEIIDDQAFWDCPKITELTLPDRLETIGWCAFYMTSLNEIYIPATTVNMTNESLLMDNVLQSIIVAEENPVFSAKDGVLFSNNGTQLEMYPIAKEGTEYTIPEGVETIKKYAFRMKEESPLVTVTIPATVKVIEDSSFGVLLKEIRFEGDAPAISETAFAKNMVAKAYYPKNNETWTGDKLQNYGAAITWEAYVKDCREHSVELWDRIEPTCTTDGEARGMCKICEEEVVKTLPANGHDYEETYTVDEPATEDATGSESRHCKNCSATKDSRVIPKLESVYNDVHTVVQEKEVENLTEEDKITVKEQVAALASEAKKAEENGNVAAKEVEENLDTSAVVMLEELYIASDDSVEPTVVEVNAEDIADVKAEGAALTVENYKQETTEDVKYQSKITIIVPETTEDEELDQMIADGTAVVLDINMSVVNVDTGEAVSEAAANVQPVAPIKFSLPVPEGMQEGFMLYHYKDNGEKEVVPYSIVEIDGKLYIDFVATSFSFYSFEKEEQHVHDWKAIPGEFLKATCTTEGYEVQKCSDPNCGQEMTKIVQASGHSYTDGSCINCGEKDPEHMPSETLKFASASLTLQDNIAVNFKARTSLFTEAGYTDPYVVFELNGVETVVTESYTSGVNTVFDFTNIAPHQMNDMITATLYATYNGVEYKSESISYGVISYCNNMLSKYTTDDYAKLRTLLVDLLNYGAESQIYTGYNTDNLVNGNLTETQKAWGTADARTYTNLLAPAYETIDNPSVTWKAAGLNLKDRVEIRVKFLADDINNLVIKVKDDNGNNWEIKADKFEAIPEGGYYVYFNGLNAGMMSEPVYFTMYDGDTVVSNTLRYSVESYAYSKANGADAALGKLVQAMMKYGDAAYNYVN